ncbi:MAG: C-type lectin domain-containing protein [Nanoarchaeota archaeon]|mgnify:CR=1 FL=1
MKLFLIIILYISTIVIGICQSNYTILKTSQFNNHTYILLKEKFTRHQAAKIAGQNLGYLAIPDDINENNFLVNLSNTNTFWLGIQRKESGVQKLDFIRDDNKKKVVWHNWNRLPGYFEPNFDSLNEWCAIVYGNSTPWWNDRKNTFIGKWNDQSAGWLLSVIIEIDPSVDIRLSNIATRSSFLKNDLLLCIKWQAIPNKKYIIQKSTNLYDWEDIEFLAPQTNEIIFSATVTKDVFFQLSEQK